MYGSLPDFISINSNMRNNGTRKRHKTKYFTIAKAIYACMGEPGSLSADQKLAGKIGIRIFRLRRGNP
jgi:hypothetical protein